MNNSLIYHQMSHGSFITGVVSDPRHCASGGITRPSTRRREAMETQCCYEQRAHWGLFSSMEPVSHQILFSFAEKGMT